MDYDEFDNWNENFTHRECDVMAMSLAEYNAEKVAKLALAGAGSTISSVQPVISTNPTSVSSLNPTSVLSTNSVSPNIQGTAFVTPKVILDEREASCNWEDKISQKQKCRYNEAIKDARNGCNRNEYRKIDEDAKNLTQLQEVRGRERKKKKRKKN